MKKSLYIIAATVLSVFVSSCQDDFLDEEPNQRLSPEQIAAAAETDPSLLNSFVSGLYSTMYNTGTGGTTNHDDFGQKGYDIYSDMLVSDMALIGTNYGWYTGVVRYQATQDFTQNPAYQPWRYYYRIIFSANTLIDILGGNDAPQTEPERRYIMGQAKAMRAYAYFYLAQFYATGYGTGTEKILPIYTNSNDPSQPLSTSADVYNLIVDDLTQAIELLEGFNRTAKNQINPAVAKGLLAYALAARGTTEDLNQVVTLTDDVIANYGFSLMTENEVVAQLDPATGALLNPQSGFNSVTNNSWIWGVDLTLANGLDLISYWGQVDVFTYSYAWAGDPKAIDEGLYNAIHPDDIRKGQFDAPSGGVEQFYAEDGYADGDFDYMPVNKFFDPAREIGGQRNVVTDYVYMRLEEMYLLNAEAKAKLGQDGPAKDMLKQLLQKRMTDYSYVDALSGQALQDEIYLQTRIELWGEGKAYLAMKRNQATVTRGENHLLLPGESFAWDADELTFPIPQAEVLNNAVLNQ